MAELAPEALDELGRRVSRLGELLVAELTEHGRERVDLSHRRRRIRVHRRSEAEAV